MTKSQFIVEYTHPRFAAIMPAEQILTVGDLDGDLWHFSDGDITTATFSDLVPPGSEQGYVGSLSISLVGLEVPEIVYESTRRIDVTDIGSYLLPLPTAKLRAEVTLVDLDKRVLETLRWYRTVASENGIGAPQASIDEMIEKLKECFIEDPSRLPEMLSEYQQSERRFRFLARKAREDPTSQAVDALLIERPLDPLGMGSQIVRELPGIIEALDPQSQQEAIDMLDDLKRRILSTSIQKPDNSEEYDVALRLRESLRIQKALRKFEDESTRLPNNVDPDATKQFAFDFFHLLMHYWNNAIRYLKYEKSQHWMREYPEYAAGLFYVRNRVSLDGEHILPHVTAHVRQEVLRHNLIQRREWKEIVQATSDAARLERYMLDWTVEGILSQALSHLTKGELLPPIVLGGVALEEAMTRALFHVNPDDYDKRGLGLKIKDVHRMIGREALGYEKSQWKKDWNLLNKGSKEEGTGLVQIRTRLQHPQIGLEKNIPSRKDVAEMILACQRMCNALLKYDRHRCSELA